MSEFYHHGVKGQKWGVRRYQNKDGTLTSAGRKREDEKNKNPSFISTTARFGKNLIKNPRDSVNLAAKLSKAVWNNPAGAMTYSAKNLPTLALSRNSEFTKVLNSHMDSINNDMSKISIGVDFFAKHANDTVDDILKDGNNAMVALLLMTTRGNR